jgi:hypothetical protein
MRRIALIVVLVALVSWPASAPGDRVTRGTVIQATDASVSERTVLLVHSVRRTNTLLPPYLVRLEISVPSRTRIHTSGLPRCGLAGLQARGVAACPRRARIGSASMVGRSFLDSNIGSKVTMFNGERIGSRRTILMFVDPEVGPSFVAIGKLYGRQGAGVRLDLEFPTIKILAGTGPDAIMSDFALRFDSAFLSAPCPARYRVTSHFFYGESLTSSDRARCR